MQNGVYKVLFNVGPNAGGGIVTINNGRLSGGDAGFTYVGDLTGEHDLTAEIDVRQHDSSVENVFSGLTNFRLSGTGKQMTPQSARLHGTTPAAPGHTVHVELTLLTPFN